MPSMKDWPSWLRYTLSALAGAGVTLVSVTLAFADVAHTAANAAKAAEAIQHELQVDLRPRLLALEVAVVRSDARWEAVSARLDRLEDKIDTMLDTVTRLVGPMAKPPR